MSISWRMRLLEGLRRRFGTGVANMDLEQIRAARESHMPALPLPAWLTERIEHAIFGTPRSSVTIRDTTVGGAQGELSARVYTPATLEPDTPLVVHYAGGGWTTGSPALYDWFSTCLAEDVRVVVVSVDYRKAPEHPAPAAYDDAVASFRSISERKRELGAPGRIAVAGDSAGGNLAALVAIAARDAGLDLDAQVLVYPATDLTRSFPSVNELTHEPILPRTSVDAYNDHYLSGGVEATDPRVSPWFVDDVSGVAPALVQTAEHDPLRDEGEAYAEKLAAAGVDVRFTRYVDVPHGFLSLPGVEPAARQAVAEIIHFLHTRLRDTVRVDAGTASPERTP